MTLLEYTISRSRKTFGPAVLRRILRLNPDWHEGSRLRGWRPAATLHAKRIEYDVIGKGEFIRRHGRPAWNALPLHCIRRDARRRYVERAAVEDQLWLASA